MPAASVNPGPFLHIFNSQSQLISVYLINKRNSSARPGPIYRESGPSLYVEFSAITRKSVLPEGLQPVFACDAAHLFANLSLQPGRSEDIATNCLVGR